MTPEEKKIANATSRSAGAVGSKALVPRLVRDLLAKEHPEARVLDYGAGKQAYHTKQLRSEGVKVTAHDMGDNFDPELHDPTALNRRYRIVFASNVLNTLASRKAIRDTVDEIKSLCDLWGCAVVNYPDSPRKSNVTVIEMRRILERRFRKVERSQKYGTRSRPVWVCWP